MFLSKSNWKPSLAIACAAVLSGCASPDYNYIPVSTQISEPAIDSVNIAYVGDVMLRQGKYSEHDAIYLPYKVEVSWAYDLHCCGQLIPDSELSFSSAIAGATI
ncbi:hypothetical protein AAEU31_18255 [Pseudoalteromonas sp. SSMSWG5]|uniref:hypothetical protein n=1 Tax=Pseudoalteromonas sp. SSMSWG5 TaxID=3139396 RepID=UPI003BAA7DED